MHTDHDRPLEIELTQEKETLLLTLHARALDSRQTNPILGDRTAEAVLRRLDYDFQRLRTTTTDRFATAIRAKQLDQWTRAFLREHPATTVLHLACGLDSRVERINPASSVHWYDVDYPEVVSLRRRLYPEREGCQLIASSVTDPGWLEAVPPNSSVLVVAEGLTMYLAEDELKQLLLRVIRRFSHGEIAFDAMNALGIRAMTYKASIQATGASGGWGIDNARALEAWHPRLELVEELCLTQSPEVARMPPTYRLLYGAMNRVHVLRSLGRLLHYRF